jgi:diguanylate cyclase (GGDEF)-like protein
MFQDLESPEQATVSSRFLQSWNENQPRIASLRYLSVSILLFVSYFATGRLGLRLAYIHPNATPVWPPSGIALAAFLLLGFRLWPAVFLGAFCANLPITHSAFTSLGIATGNTAEALVGAYLVQKFGGETTTFASLRGVLRFAILAAMISTAVSATVGVTSLSLGGYTSWPELGPIWLTWWSGDGVGDLVLVPLLVLWFTTPFPRWDRRKATEAIALGLYLALVAAAIFGKLLPSQTKSYPLEFLCIPFLMWAALRFGQQEAALAILMLAVISITGTLHGDGPFVGATRGESLLILQLFIGIVAIMTHAVAAVVSERHRAEQALRKAHDELAEKAISDPLTGLANYRHFVDVFEREADRSHRTGRPFALVLFDLDDLKKINDAHGHLVGTRALCRVGNTMRVYCRTIDTAVRYGGDEFALLLPETSLEGARQVARRIAAQVAGDGESPSIAVSFGIALCPKDGRTIEHVFGKADAGLYRMKNNRRPSALHDNGV